MCYNVTRTLSVHRMIILERCCFLALLFISERTSRGGVKRGPTLSTSDALVLLACSAASCRSWACPAVKVAVVEPSLSAFAVISVSTRTARSCSTLATAWIVQ